MYRSSLGFVPRPNLLVPVIFLPFLEEKRDPLMVCQGVGEAIPEVESSRMPALAESAISIGGGIGERVVRGNGIGDREPYPGYGGQGIQQGRGVELAQQDRSQGAGIDRQVNRFRSATNRWSTSTLVVLRSGVTSHASRSNQASSYGTAAKSVSLSTLPSGNRCIRRSTRA
jgi:hypothetical protein